MTLRPAPKTAFFALALAAALTLAGERAEACSCVPPDLTRIYNQSSEVVRARIRWALPYGNWVFYRARVLKTFKGCLEPLQWALLVTQRFGAACGVHFEVGDDVLVTGHRVWRSPHFLRIGLCDYNVPFDSLSPRELDFLNSRFSCCGDDCQCVNRDPVLCFVDPCQVASCPEAECVANYCGGCRAEFYDESGAAVCQPCQGDEDCSFGQHCSELLGRCLSGCELDGDCREGNWCRRTQQGGAECTPFQQEGEPCGGFTPFWAQLRCAPDLVCTDFPPQIADAPGVCRRPCGGEDDCGHRQYCASGGVCRDDGACRLHLDCNLPGNDYIHPLCVGHGVCHEGQCGWRCGDPRCVDLAGVDFGPCEALIGWGVVDGECRPLSGCDNRGLDLFFPGEECEQACNPPSVIPLR